MTMPRHLNADSQERELVKALAEYLALRRQGAALPAIWVNNFRIILGWQDRPEHVADTPYRVVGLAGLNAAVAGARMLRRIA